MTMRANSACRPPPSGGEAHGGPSNEPRARPTLGRAVMR